MAIATRNASMGLARHIHEASNGNGRSLTCIKTFWHVKSCWQLGSRSRFLNQVGAVWPCQIASYATLRGPSSEICQTSQSFCIKDSMHFLDCLWLLSFCDCLLSKLKEKFICPFSIRFSQARIRPTFQARSFMVSFHVRTIVGTSLQDGRDVEASMEEVEANAWASL